MAYYTTAEIRFIADQVCATYAGANSLSNWYANYRWQDAAVEQAWETRQGLQSNLIATSFGLPELQAIYQWGFNNTICYGLNDPALLSSLQACLHSFQTGARLQQQNSLAAFLTLQRTANARIGLASLSKWICFIDQARFAIFDSRVSRALFPVRVDFEHRAFPVLPGRTSGGFDPITNWSPNRLACMYLDYLDVVRQVAILQNDMQPAQVEMALFMIGQPILPRPLNPGLRRSMWI